MGEYAALERRLVRLENQNRRWKNAAGTLAVLGGAWFALGASAIRSRARLVEGTEFRLVDEKGTSRAVLAVGRSGTAISVNNGAGKTRAALTVGDDGAPRLELFDRADSPRASLKLAGDGSPALSLSDDGKRTRAEVSLGPEGSPKVELKDETGKPRGSIAIGAEGGAAIVLAGSPCSSVKLLEDDGSIRAALGCTALKEAGSGKSESTEPSSLVLFDKRGRVVYKAPK
ncbi:MAG: hypothetical protein ACRD16_08675 [Thermoanaerobaculia bacterium]